MNTIKIDQQIISQRVVTEQETEIEMLETMHEGINRPEMLFGSTSKITPGGYDHALYITINDYLLNEGTDHEQLIPYEIFLNSKAMENFQWIVSLTRVISAIFRKGGDVTFLIEELGSVFDPKGGYWQKGKFYPSVVAHIGEILKLHLIHIGIHKEEGLSDHTKEILAKKRADFEALHGDTGNEYPPQATLCDQCGVKAVIVMDNCGVCLNCASSKCG